MEWDAHARIYLFNWFLYLVKAVRRPGDVDDPGTID